MSLINYKLNIVGVRPHSKSWNVNTLVGSPWQRLGNLQRLFSTKRQNNMCSIVSKSEAKSTRPMLRIKRSKSSLVSPRKSDMTPAMTTLTKWQRCVGMKGSHKFQFHHDAKGVNKGMLSKLVPCWVETSKDRAQLCDMCFVAQSMSYQNCRVSGCDFWRIGNPEMYGWQLKCFLVISCSEQVVMDGCRGHFYS